MGLQAVILDFDGVLAKSMEQHAESYRLVLRPYGIEVTDREVFAREGARSESIVREFLERDGKDHDDALVKRLAEEKQRVFRELGTPALYPDAKGMFEDLREVVPLIGLVTGTRQENLERMIPDLLPRLDAVLAQHSYKQDKPHPEPYQKAIQALGVRPEGCLVLENAVRGVKSARAAGVARVVGITTTMPAAALQEAGAHEVVRDHRTAARSITALF